MRGKSNDWGNYITTFIEVNYEIQELILIATISDLDRVNSATVEHGCDYLPGRRSTLAQRGGRDAEYSAEERAKGGRAFETYRGGDFRDGQWGGLQDAARAGQAQGCEVLVRGLAEGL